jgi:hypothetical protein
MKRLLIKYPIKVIIGYTTPLKEKKAELPTKEVLPLELYG